MNDDDFRDPGMTGCTKCGTTGTIYDTTGEEHKCYVCGGKGEVPKQ